MLDKKHLEYAELLLKWGKAFNLTGARDAPTIITQHIQDSLSLLPFLTDTRTILDVGTGAGLPGIPLAIARPDLKFILLDSTRKKINFVQHVVTSLQLANVDPRCARVETLVDQLPADMIVTRAVASLGEFAGLIRAICSPDTKIIAMKGRRDQAELEAQQLPADFKLLNIEDVKVPGLAAERCLVFLGKQRG